MNPDIIFRITRKALRNGKIFSRIVPLSKFDYLDEFWEGDTYKILSIDRFTGFKDKNGVDIYESDTVTQGELTGKVSMCIEIGYNPPSFCMYLNIGKWQIINNKI